MANTLRWKFNNKRNCAKMLKIEFLLTFEEYCELAKQAGITAPDIGIRGYHLARVGDIGPYKMGNCRFLWCTDNIKERKVTEKGRLILSKKMKNRHSSLTPKQAEDRNLRLRKGYKDYWNSLSDERKKFNSHALTVKEIKKRHKMLLGFVGKIEKKYWVKELSRKLGLSKWGARHFIKKYPIKSD